jgi:hypothetical protein
MSGALPTPPDSGSRATAARWVAEVQQAGGNEDRVRLTNITPEWCTPRPAPDAYTLADLAAATRRCLYPDEAGPSRPRAARLASDQAYGEPDEYHHTDENAAGNNNGSSNASDRILPASTKSSQIRAALSRIDENIVTPPTIPTRNHSRTARNRSEQLASSPETAPVYPKPPHFARRAPPASPSSNPFSDTHAAPPRPSRFSENFAASMPAQLARDITPPVGQGARISNVEYVTEAGGAETEAAHKRWTLGALQGEFRSIGKGIQERLAEKEKDKEANKEADKDKPAPLPQFSWPQIAVLGAVMVDLTIYTGVALSKHRTGTAYKDWSPSLSNATLKALDGTGMTMFNATSADEADMYTISTQKVSLSEQQKAAVCVDDVMPTFNLTSSHRISGMANLSPRGAGFPAVGIPSFGNAVAFIMVVCGIFELLREGVRRALRRWQLKRWEGDSVSLLGKVVDAFLGWGEVVAIVLGSVFTSLLISGVVTAVFNR